MKDDEKSVEASHGRWIREIQKSLKVIEKNLSLLEERVSAFESEMTKRSKNHRDLKSEIDRISANLERINGELGLESEGSKNGL
ncbi:hypothetical protein AKJ52_00525 [candidate division MSBL1 archaeon SCGC-AAA382C18]|uniref:Uncharacterized protein n=1 Tax=candidate division MSBL1 archaeon SCGC-AAA382C18 TaxID=1698281 RepID=A0A133VLI4_9EURY|nr:hypothetical protein AKJ52_00525 [candidate division MSBL1 archaeon SCGC-AAA382C18]